MGYLLSRGFELLGLASIFHSLNLIVSAFSALFPFICVHDHPLGPILLPTTFCSMTLPVFFFVYLVRVVSDGLFVASSSIFSGERLSLQSVIDAVLYYPRCTLAKTTPRGCLCRKIIHRPPD